jgi:hypothetical protein
LTPGWVVNELPRVSTLQPETFIEKEKSTLENMFHSYCLKIKVTYGAGNN